MFGIFLLLDGVARSLFLLKENNFLSASNITKLEEHYLSGFKQKTIQQWLSI